MTAIPRPFTGSFFISFGTEINWLPVLILGLAKRKSNRSIKNCADADSFKDAGVMRTKTRRRFTQTQSKCLAEGYKCAIMTIIIMIDKVFYVKKIKMILVWIF